MKTVEEIVNKEKFEMGNSEMFFENKIKNNIWIIEERIWNIWKMKINKFFLLNKNML